MINIGIAADKQKIYLFPTTGIDIFLEIGKILSLGFMASDIISYIL
ncbi:MAG: hypothetical protein ACLRXQ_02435 [Phascolarctobacterium faecium]